VEIARSNIVSHSLLFVRAVGRNVKARVKPMVKQVGKVVIRVYRLHLPNCGLRNESLASEGTWLPVVGVEKKYAKAALDRHIDGRDFFSVVLMDGSAVIGGANGGGLDHSVFRCRRGKI
jgi:hypothetical protein